MPVRPAIGRPTDRAPPQLTSPSDRLWACDCEGALSKPREARHRHGAPVRAPFLRCSVSIRYLRNLRFLKVRGSSASQ
jgi:hypothetical protein